MNALRIGPLGARRAGIRPLVALCGVLIAAGFLAAALTAAGTEATRAGDFQLAAGPAGADPPACSGDGVYLYDDINYGGRCGKFTGSAVALADWNFNDLASSFKLAGSYSGGRYRVTLCENASYAGACSSYLADDPWLGDGAIGNDRASSAKIEVNTNCTGDGVYLYEDRDYWGRCWKWTADDPLFDEEYFHDRASSLRFMGSYGDGRYTATLYRDMNYGGASMAFGADDPWLGDDAIGSDQADAIRIRAVPACTGDGVYLYEGANYTGRCRKFTASEPYLDTVAFADIASSVRLAGSYAGGDIKVTLCENARYGGACSTFAGNDANLGTTAPTRTAWCSTRLPVPRQVLHQRPVVVWLGQGDGAAIQPGLPPQSGGARGELRGLPGRRQAVHDHLDAACGRPVRRADLRGRGDVRRCRGISAVDHVFVKKIPYGR